ncbi:addiction module toxin RelE [Mesobaculum littorinae]|uniref:Addiction module toxin RelE n=1 Tax=Mesobaculum littorinae TaxID=2486419 RepID=A0A438AI01_9RHOB|nr:addiction module toxin RelE [Mesobaculum littorinae]RVV98278.1 addiction module toxin RelE [Mesobaculum littorinae]
MPIFLVTAFAKNEEDTPAKAQQAGAVELSKRVVAMYEDER